LWYHLCLHKNPLFTRFPIGSPEAEGCDVQLYIGDRALAVRGKTPYQVDLGSVWTAWTDTPFVYAVWMVRRYSQNGELVDLGQVADFLTHAPAKNMPHLPAIALSASETLGLDSQVCVEYLTHSLQYRLDPEAQAGLQKFLHMTWLNRDSLPDCISDLPIWTDREPLLDFYPYQLAIGKADAHHTTRWGGQP
jgi:predicted solute-binding protein